MTSDLPFPTEPTQDPMRAKLALVHHWRPRSQPEFVHQLTRVLYAPYTVEGGQVHLVGCHMENVPFWVVEADDRTRFFDQEGQQLSEPFVESLQLKDREPMDQPPQGVRPQDLFRWIEQLESRLATQGQSAAGSGIVWCKWVQGKLAFRIGDATQAIGFQGWAVHLATGQIRPPELICPRTGARGFHVLATAEGVVTVPQATEICSRTGERHFREDLEQCAVSHVWALPRFFSTCQATGVRILTDLLETCQQCELEVAPTAILGGRCCLCHDAATAAKVDAAQGPLWMQEVGRSGPWKRFRGALGPSHEIWVSTTWTTQRLWVVEVETQAVIRIRERLRWQRQWRTVLSNAGGAE